MSEGLFKAEFHRGIPIAAQELMWRVFFESRGRGVSLARHFPWINSPDGVYCVLIENINDPDKNKIIATLAMRQEVSADGVRYGLIGLVCVDEKFRGNGLSSLLLERAIQAGIDLNWSALVLWTQKPEIYQNHEFVIDGRELFAHVSNQLAIALDKDFDYRFAHQDEKFISSTGLPGFASALVQIKTENISVLVLKTESGCSIADWEGADNEVANFLINVMPKNWGINYLRSDRLISVLRDRGLELQTVSGGTRMVRKLANSVSADYGNIRILNRI
jgi:GNAT superfamily N-acetyltransferase